MPRTISKTTEEIFNELREDYGTELTAQQVQQYANDVGISYMTITKRLEPYKVKRGHWNLDLDTSSIESIENSYKAPDAIPAIPEDFLRPVAQKSQHRITQPQTQNIQPKITQVPTQNNSTQNNSVFTQNLIPDFDKNFVPFGNFSDIKKIIKSKLFYPVFITGLSGNGKTQSVAQACSQLGRELIRVNITIETDEDDLVGGFRLVNGATQFHYGPVVEAMRKGAILLLDEIDLASNKIMCLQPILEGNGLFIKKIGEFIKPAEGFNIIATANTKGKGSEDGRFIGTNILNDAFLERFSITLEQDYPTPTIEKKILINYMNSLNCVDDDFAEKLCTWADVIRKSFADGSMDEVITTRRLIHLIKAYSIFNNKKKALELICNRFDDETKQNFVEFYTKIDVNVTLDDNTDPVNDIENDEETVEDSTEIEPVNSDGIDELEITSNDDEDGDEYEDEEFPELIPDDSDEESDIEEYNAISDDPMVNSDNDENEYLDDPEENSDEDYFANFG